MKLSAAITALAAFAATATAVPTSISARGGDNGGGTCENPGRTVWIVTETNDPVGDYYGWGTAALQDIRHRLTSESEATASNKADRIAVTSLGDVDATQFYELMPLSDPENPQFDIAMENRTNLIHKGWSIEFAYDHAWKSMNDKFHVHKGLGCFIAVTDCILRDESVERFLQQITEARQQGYRTHLLAVRGERSHPVRYSMEHPDNFLAQIGQGFNNWFAKAFPDKAAVSHDETTKRIMDAVRAAGGTVVRMESEQNAKDWVNELFKNGLTDLDGKCVDTGDNENTDTGGGELVPDQVSHGLCSKNAETVFTYSPKKDEHVEVTVTLTSTESPANIEATLLNTVSGETKFVTINKGNIKGILEGSGKQGESVKVTLKTSNADSNKCEYSVSLKTSVPQPPPTSSATASSASAPPPTSSATASSVLAPPPTSSATASSASAPPPTSSATASSASAPPPSSATPSPSATPSECPVPEVPTTTITSTVVETVTGSAAPQPTNSYCVCKCDVKGAKPWPKFEL